jgi:hypothetical protein
MYLGKEGCWRIMLVKWNGWEEQDNQKFLVQSQSIQIHKLQHLLETQGFFNPLAI